MTITYTSIGNWFAPTKTWEYQTTIEKHWYWGVQQAQQMRNRWPA